jgi:polyphosphate kinase
MYYFNNGGKEEIYLGSADLMTRSYDHRVEVVFPLENQEHINYLRHGMLAIYLNDNTRARIMQPDGTYVRLKPPSEDKAVDVQEWLMKRLNTRKAETI